MKLKVDAKKRNFLAAERAYNGNLLAQFCCLEFLISFSGIVPT
jgi:hypothetical protein